MIKLIPGILAFADGEVYQGQSMTIEGVTCGELVFNTGQSGYQEVLTDPSYNDQIVLFTQPHIGNVGVNLEDMESKQVQVKGMVAKSISTWFSNWRSQGSLIEFLQSQKIIALSHLDTRAITHKLRTLGNQAACIMAGSIDVEKAISQAKRFTYTKQAQLLMKVSTSAPYRLNSLTGKQHVVVCDFGVKKSILTNLESRGCQLTVVPANTTSAEILSYQPDGIVLSNGPGDPQAAKHAILVVQSLLSYKIPVMGICFGHQLLALASGAKTKKMALGHHGINHPIVELDSGRVSISSQNHGFVVDEISLPNTLRITHRSLFDQTIAGIARTDLPAFGFQGHPEASPGPKELGILFDQFMQMMSTPYAKAYAH